MTGSPEALDLYPLPLGIDEITTAWLTAALRTRRPDVTVAAMNRVDVVEGTATKILVDLTYAGPAGNLPARMWIKGGFADHREFVGNLGVYSGEVRYFNDVAPRYSLRQPRAYFAVAQDDPVQGILGLEDLRARGVSFARATRPMTPGQAAAGLETLADLHGRTWGRHRSGPGGLRMVMDPEGEAIWQWWFNTLDQQFATPRGFAAPVALHDPVRLHAGAIAYRAIAHAGHDCVVHGDAHVGNSYLERDGTVGFVDWQTAAVGRWAHDVNYFLVSALDLPDRQAYERGLLEHYLKALATYDITAPAPDDAWDDYRRSTVYGFLCWLCNSPDWQPEDVNTATYARFGSAMLDHQTYAVLGV